MLRWFCTSFSSTMNFISSIAIQAFLVNGVYLFLQFHRNKISSWNHNYADCIFNMWALIVSNHKTNTHTGVYICVYMHPLTLQPKDVRGNYPYCHLWCSASPITVPEVHRGKMLLLQGPLWKGETQSLPLLPLLPGNCLSLSLTIQR